MLDLDWIMWALIKWCPVVVVVIVVGFLVRNTQAIRTLTTSLGLRNVLSKIPGVMLWGVIVLVLSPVFLVVVAIWGLITPAAFSFAAWSFSDSSSTASVPRGGVRSVYREEPFSPHNVWTRFYLRGPKVNAWELLPISSVRVRYDFSKSPEGGVVYGGTNHAHLAGQRVDIHFPHYNAIRHTMYMKSGEYGAWRRICGVNDKRYFVSDAGALFIKGSMISSTIRPFMLYFSASEPERNAKNGVRIATTKLLPAQEKFFTWGALPRHERWKLYIRLSSPFDRLNGGIIPPKMIGECPAIISLGPDRRDVFEYGETVFEMDSAGVRNPGMLRIQPPLIGEEVRVDVIMTVYPPNHEFT